MSTSAIVVRVPYGSLTSGMARRESGFQRFTAEGQVRDLFSQPRGTGNSLVIGGRTYAELPRTGGAAIFEGVPDAEIMTFFRNLTGSASLPSPTVAPGGSVYVVATPHGNFHLRNVSSSAAQTGARWTIDVPKSFLGLPDKKEIKFR